MLPPPILRAALGLGTASIAAQADAGGEVSWQRAALEEVRKVSTEGSVDLHLSGLYWHLPFAYPREKRARLNDAALGIGLGRSLAVPGGPERGVFAQVSRSSHFKPQYVAGYFRLARWPLAGGLQFGAGYAAFVFARSDVYHYLPLPGAAPLVSLGTDRVAVYVSFLPRIHDAITGTGNVFYLYVRVKP